MQCFSRKSSRNLILLCSLIVAMIISFPIQASAYGPLTMYTADSSTSVRYGTLYPHAIQLKHQSNPSDNGKMYATFEKYTVAPFTFPVFESVDNGKSWTRLPDVTDQVNGWGLKQEPHLFELPESVGDMPAGTLLMIGNSEPVDDSQTKIDIYKSNDLGRTWTFASSVASGGAATMGTSSAIWEPYLIYANNKLICFYSDERGMASGGQKIVAQSSTDGVNWSAPFDVVNFSSTNVSYRPGMPVVAQMANGQYIMVYEFIGKANAPVNFKITSNPESWNPTDPGTTYGYGGSPYVAVMNDGKVVAGSYSTTDIYVNSNNGTGTWIRQATPIGNGYRRLLLPLMNGRLFVMNGGPLREPALNSVTYADMPVNGVSGQPIYFKIVNPATGLALDGMGNTTPGADVDQYHLNDTDNQLWYNVDIGNGYFKIVNKATGLRLDTMGRTTDGSIVGQYTDSSSYNQQWSIVSQSGDYWKIVNRATGKALDTGTQTGDATAMQQWSSSSSSNQLWRYSSN
ncbi:RICIN domain-containing protein [Paenibacillus sp. HN-1]|uniref:RICIN domain-containing protein n=2 Tax=Paenibacillus TaxID=44249 RepID=UPI001CA9247A|nr:RICIN domain-containing protein [Paenibacillus sp. CGMCC 1.18879]MBY9080729.1 RICIN domain-containing protein [Paenibacillus sp. CGMCC 1.18879]MBY9085279.1 RICIN domain-containing protein [Paenibacillus sinensis]